MNFCKFTNETRNGMEDSSARSGLKFLAAVNGACAGGGYELALACDEIVMVDDRSSTVSLPEVALLGVLPGTGGLTRLIDKRKVRRDLADLFCTTAEGVRADRAKAWGLVDHIAPPPRFAETVRSARRALAADSDRPAEAAGVALPPFERCIGERGYHYRWVEVEIRPRRAHSDADRHRAAGRRRARRSRRHPRRRSALVAAGDGARARRRDPAAAR